MGGFQSIAATGAALAMLAWGSDAVAQTNDFDLDYAAERDCASVATFAGLVERQLAEYDAGSAQAGRASVIVRLRHTEQGYAARFELTRADGSRSSRELTAASCAEAAPALAFVLALALGGRESDAPLEPQPAKPPLAPLPAPSPPPPHEAALPPPPVAAPKRRAARLRYGMGFELGVRSGLGPVWTPIEAGGIEIERAKTGWVWQTRLSFMWDQPVTQRNDVGSTRLAWLGLGFGECPFEVSLGAGFRALPCLGGHLGRLKAAGHPLPGPGAQGRTAKKVWLDLGVGLRLEYRFLRYLSLGLRGELLAPVTRYRVAFDPSTPVYPVPALAGEGALGLGARFP